jgi:wyosine [tRNA(Phe)-imidazoG37] synthetase (radical SAM superfamily)
VIEGQKTFRALFGGQVWMEVFLVEGMNSSPKEVTKIAAWAREIAPGRIQLNTAKTLSAAITDHKEQKHPLNGVKKRYKWRIWTIENVNQNKRIL